MSRRLILLRKRRAPSHIIVAELSLGSPLYQGCCCCSVSLIGLPSCFTWGRRRHCSARAYELHKFFHLILKGLNLGFVIHSISLVSDAYSFSICLLLLQRFFHTSLLARVA